MHGENYFSSILFPLDHLQLPLRKLSVLFAAGPYFGTQYIEIRLYILTYVISYILGLLKLIEPDTLDMFTQVLEIAPCATGSMITVLVSVLSCIELHKEFLTVLYLPFHWC